MVLITLDDVSRHKARESSQHDYEIVKNLADNCYLVRRKSDNGQFLGYPWDVDVSAPEFHGLMERGAKHAVANVFNHPNIVSHIGTQIDFQFRGTARERRGLLLWDFCDAGTLDSLLRTTALQPRVCTETGVPITRGFLPESLCWHVAISMLKALAWLHEGYREEDYLDEDDAVDSSGKPKRSNKGWVMDKDWMPILHRDIRPQNIFFQHPSGTETYGFCKLANFGNCFVSGHVNDWSGGQVVSTKDGDEKLEILRKTMAVDNIYTIPRDKRPYTKGTELFHLGSCLYRMMTKTFVPDPEECRMCGIRHWDLDLLTQDRQVGCYRAFILVDKCASLTDYSADLRNVLYLLLNNYRGGANDFNAIEMLSEAKEGYRKWRENDPDGKLYRDFFDDEVQRQVNRREKRTGDRAQTKAQTEPSEAAGTKFHWMNV